MIASEMKKWALSNSTRNPWWIQSYQIPMRRDEIEALVFDMYLFINVHDIEVIKNC